MNEFPELLSAEQINEKHKNFSPAIFSLNKEIINKNNFKHLTKIYYATKKLDIRLRILKLLYDFDFPELKDFFNDAYRKERYLDLKICALRGLSQFIMEKEIALLLQKFNQTLAKRQESTPYNYQEYELLRGQNALPYLVKRYNYDCFRKTYEQLENQYHAMPDAFKGHFTTDENGEHVALRTPGESKKMINDFFQGTAK